TTEARPGFGPFPLARGGIYTGRPSLRAIQVNTMELAMIGLGRMGANMAQRLLRGGHRVIGFDPMVAARRSIEEKGAQSAASPRSSGPQWRAPKRLWRRIWAAGKTDQTM